MNRIKFLKKGLLFGLLIGLATGMALPGPATAAWPTKDINLIIPYRPGGGFDIQARIFCPIWEKHLSQKANVIVANRPGAGGNIGATAFIKSPSDGHTVGLFTPAGLALLQYEGGMEGQDIRKWTWLGQLSWDPGAIVVSAASGIKTPQDLTKREIRNGAMDEGLFSGAYFARKLNVKARQVVFDGTPELILAVMRGDMDLMMESWPSMKKAVENSQGKLVPLLILADNRLPEWPSVPCSKELNLDLTEIYSIAGTRRLLAAPTGVPAALAKTIEETIWATLQDPEFKAKMDKAGYPLLSGRGADAANAVATTLKVILDNKDILESLKKK